jgi:hypothetical protein
MPGNAGGLFTHTPVDWAGNEQNLPQQTPPAAWPTDAILATPPAGTRPSTTAITAVSVTGITATAATVNFTLSASGTNQVEYGLTNAYGLTNTEGSGTGPQTKALAGLTTATVYHYRVRATINGATTRTADATFTTS